MLRVDCDLLACSIFGMPSVLEWIGWVRLPCIGMDRMGTPTHYWNGSDGYAYPVLEWIGLVRLPSIRMDRMGTTTQYWNGSDGYAYPTVSQDIRDQLNAKAEAVQIILTGIDNDIYSTVDACPNAFEMWKAIERNRGKAIVNSPQPIYDQEPSMVAKDDKTSKDKEIDKLMALISLSFKKIYKPTNNNLRTLSNTSRGNQDNSSRVNKGAGYEHQRFGNVAGARKTVGKGCTLSQGKDAIELEAHYMYMAQLQEVSPDSADSGPIFDAEPLQKNDDDNDLANERELLASLIEKLKCEIDESKNHNKFLETSNKVLIEKLKGKIKDFKNKNKSLESSNNRFKEANNKLSKSNNLMYTDFKKSQAELARRNSMEYASKMEIECAQKEAQIKLYKTREDEELDKVIALENKVKVLDNIVHKTGQSVQTMNMLNNKCRTSFAKPEFLKKAQRANPHLPFDYDKLNNLYDLFIPQREKSSEQRHFSERSKLSHTSVNNGNSKESFNKQTTLLEKRMDESISWDKKCKSSIEIFKVKTYVHMIFNGVELCKEKISRRTYSGYLDPFIQNTIEANFSPEIRRINAGLEQFHKCLNEEIVADRRYFNSLELEIDSLRSQLETQKTQFLNEID
nr:hypothetical protein [Tanacetum cinerariifolium]